MPPTLSPFQRHKSKWIGCTLCPLCEKRKHVVLLRGNVPCDVLFIGEAPGASEDVLGRPFVGPAGKLLDLIIDRAKETVDNSPDFQPPTIAMTNLVACIPLGNDGDKIEEPPEDSIKECAPRLEDVYNLCKPRLIVCVGKLARKWLDKVIPHRDTPSVEIIHPAAILRADISRQGLAVQTAVVTLSDAFAELD